MTPLRGGATNGLKSMTYPHFCSDLDMGNIQLFTATVGGWEGERFIYSIYLPLHSLHSHHKQWVRNWRVIGMLIGVLRPSDI